MPLTLSAADRIRINRTIWFFDALLWDLPTRRRRALRAELRANLLAAAAETGAADAVRRLGSLRTLADEYLNAEWPSGRRPRWLLGTYWAALVEVVFTLATLVGFVSFMDGVEATGGRATGTYHWDGWLGPLGPRGEVTLDGGEFAGFEFQVSLWFFLAPAVAFLLGSRAWRSIPSRSSRRGS